MKTDLPQTELRNARSLRLGSLPVADCLQLILEEDRAIPDALDAARPALTRFVGNLAARFARGGRLIYLGAGTSGRLAVLDAAEMAPTFQLEPGRIVALIAGGQAALTRAIEGAEDDLEAAHAQLQAMQLTEDDSLLGISASGRTPYVLGALQFAKEQVPGCLRALLCCAKRQRPDHVDELIVLPTGPEVLTGSTRMKAGSATKQALNAISTTLMVQEGRVVENLMVALDACNEKLIDRKARIECALKENRQPKDLRWRIRLDAGATKSAFCIEEIGGKTQTVIGPGLNPYELEAHQVAAKLQGLLHELRIGSGQRLADILAESEVSAGIAGSARPGFRQLFIDCFTLHGAQKIEIRNDAFETLESLGDPAVLLVAGTGSICVGRCGDKTALAGGLGRVLGDEGSGYEIGLQGLRAAFQAMQGWGPTTQLVDATREHFSHDFDELLFAINRQQLSKAEIAAFAPLVAQCASTGDLPSQQILEKAAHALAQLAATVLEQLAQLELTIHCHGGVFSSSAGAAIRSLIAQHPSLKTWKAQLH